MRSLLRFKLLVWESERGTKLWFWEWTESDRISAPTFDGHSEHVQCSHWRLKASSIQSTYNRQAGCLEPGLFVGSWPVFMSLTFAQNVKGWCNNSIFRKKIWKSPGITWPQALMRSIDISSQNLKNKCQYGKSGAEEHEETGPGSIGSKVFTRSWEFM